MKLTATIYRLLLASVLYAALFSPGAMGAPGSEPGSGKLFLPSADVMADVENAMESARANNRLLLIVLGANWCHDSRALASRLYQEPLNSLIENSYQVVFVDVGFLDKGSEVIQAIGPPVYYATPTVLIVDPVSGRLVNEGNRHQWGSADTISMEDSVAYFRMMADTDLVNLREEQALSGELEELLVQIDTFEQVQAERLFAAYRVIGPMLQAYKEGNPPEQFENFWNLVRDFRLKVAIDVENLRRDAVARTSAGEKVAELTYPHYAAFPWETSGPANPDPASGE